MFNKWLLKKDTISTRLLTVLTTYVIHTLEQVERQTHKGGVMYEYK